MEVKLKGETMEGIFRGRMMQREGWAGSEYTERECTYYWYEGCGLIKELDEQYFFSFRTPSRESEYNPANNLSLEECLVYLGGRVEYNDGGYRERFKKRVILEKYAQLVDLVLRDSISQVLASKDDIPEVVPKELKLDDLIEKGFCYEDGGQVRMALG